MSDTTNQLPSSFNSGLVPEGFRVSATGTYAVNREGDFVPMTITPCWISAKCSTPGGKNWSIRVHYFTPDGDERVRLVPYGDFSGSRLSPHIQAMADDGLLIYPSGERNFRDYLVVCAGQPKLPKILLIGHLGFFSLPSGTGSASGVLGFMLPDAVITPDEPCAEHISPESLAFQPAVEGTALRAYAAAGKLEDWQALVAPLRRNALHVLTVSAGVAAPFASLAGLEGGAIHLHGESSAGKTASLQLAVSVFGRGADPQRTTGPTGIERWHSTANAMETIATMHSGMLLALDEIGSGQGHDIYNLVAGAGKARMTETGGRREALRWFVNGLSTGEKSVKALIEEDGKRRARTGELIRIIDVPMDQLPTDDSKTPEEMGRLVDVAKVGCSQIYGVAGREYVQSMLTAFAGDEQLLRENLQAQVAAAADQLRREAREAGLKVKNPQSRAMPRLALIEVIGVDACACGILPFEEADVRAAVRAARDAWLSGVCTLTEGERAIDSIRDYVSTHWNQIVDHDALREDDLPIRFTPRGLINDGKLLLTNSQLREACGDVPVDAALAALESKGILHRTETRNRKAQNTLGKLDIYRRRYYTLYMDKLGPALGEDEDDSGGTSDYEVVPGDDLDAALG